MSQFQERLERLRKAVQPFGDKAELEAHLDTAGKAYASAISLKAVSELPTVQALVHALDVGGDNLAQQILHADITTCNPNFLLSMVAKYQALEHIRSTFNPAASELIGKELEETVQAAVEAAGLNEKK